jgi:DNA invertase Pin-like site-specific DNA recombinase
LGTEESNPMGRFMLTIMAAFAELEREMIVERVVGGVRKAQAAGKHCGRPRRVFRRDQLIELKAAGKSWTEISKTLGVPVGTLRNALLKPTSETTAVQA